MARTRVTKREDVEMQRRRLRGMKGRGKRREKEKIARERKRRVLYKG